MTSRGRLPGRHVALVVVDLLHHQAGGERLPHERAPAGTLQAGGRLAELRPQRRERAERVGDRRRELAFGLAAAVGAHRGPEDGVQQVPRHVERERLLEAAEPGRIGGSRRAQLDQLVQRGVSLLDVTGVVGVVVELDDPRRVVGLERRSSRTAARGVSRQAWVLPGVEQSVARCRAVRRVVRSTIGGSGKSCSPPVERGCSGRRFRRAGRARAHDHT